MSGAEFGLTREVISHPSRTRSRDELNGFLASDARWADLPADFQTLTTITAKDMLQKRTLGLYRTVIALDTSRDPYLVHMRATGGSLTNTYQNITGNLRENAKWRTKDVNQEMARRILRITTADRLMGSRLAQTIGWNQTMGFGVHTTHAKNAMEVCKSAVQRFAR